MNRSANSTTRRDFGRTALAAAAVGALPALASAAVKSRRIGIVDDYLDNYHSRTYLKILREQLKDRGFEVTGAYALQAEKGRQWCQEYGVTWYDSVAELNEVVDFFAVLAPGTPQVHLELCQQVFPFSKPTFVDKTFAPDAETAERIFALADEHDVVIETSSALRYTPVQEFVKSVGRDKIRHVVTWGPGGSFDEYAIHPLEMAISCLGHEVEGVMRRGDDRFSQLLLNCSGGRTAVVHVYVGSRTPYAAMVSTSEETRYINGQDGQLFVNAAAAILDFFDAGQSRIDRRETMAIMRILDAARDARSREGFVGLVIAEK